MLEWNIFQEMGVLITKGNTFGALLERKARYQPHGVVLVWGFS